MDKAMLIDAIVGIGLAGAHAERMVAVGLATFTGNQHNEAYAWVRSRIEELELGQAIDLYLKLREMRGDPLAARTN